MSDTMKDRTLDVKRRAEIEAKLREDLEIVELNEKLDLSFDPFAALAAGSQDPDNCHNNNCC